MAADPIAYSVTGLDSGGVVEEFKVSWEVGKDFAESGSGAWYVWKPGYITLVPDVSIQLRPFHPKDDIPLDMRIWLDGRQFEGSAAPIEQWSDSSGNDFHVTQPQVLRQPQGGVITGTIVPPVGGVSDWPAANFSATGNIDPNSDYLTNDDFTATSGSMVFMVARFDGTMVAPGYTGAHLLCDTTPPTPRFRINLQAGPPITYNYEVATGPVMVGSVYDNNPHVFCIDYGVPNVSLYIDGVLDVGGLLFTTPWNGLMVGADPDGGGGGVEYAWDGPIAEVLVYNGTATAAARKSITEWLASKYTIALP
jgi:hypothetical protein